MSTAPIDQLKQLEIYLAQDPLNGSLLAEAFKVALQSRQFETAARHLETGLGAGFDAAVWLHRRAHLLMAQHQWPAARQQLGDLRLGNAAPPELVLTSTVDEAYVALRQGDAAHGIALLAPLVEDAPPPEPAIQALWLRLLYLGDKMERAMRDAQSWAAGEAMSADALGVASLLAFDLGELAQAEVWAKKSLAQGSNGLDAMVALANVALSKQQLDQALLWLDEAHLQHPTDGRTLSSRGLARLGLGDLAGARADFELAVRYIPEHVGTWHGLGWLAVLGGDITTAKSVFERALALDRNFAESHGGLAVVLARAGDRDGASASIALALKLNRACASASYAQTILDGRADDSLTIRTLAESLIESQRRGSDRS